MTAQPETAPYSPSPDERTLACITHLTVFVPSIGLLVAVGLWIYLHTQRRYPFAAFQAAQAAIYQLILTLLTVISVILALSVLFGIVGVVLAASSGAGEVAVGIVLAIGSILVAGVVVLVILAFYGYAVFAAIRSYQAQPFRIPLVHRIASMISSMPNVQPEGKEGDTQ